jgi:WXG100 family type VII secretion target
MASNPTSVDIQGMTTAQGNFQSALDQVNTAYSNMTEQQSTLAANWTGETASTFGGALNQWLDDFNTVKTQLSNMLETLSQNTGVYTNTNEGSQQMASSFTSGMSGVTGLGI